MTTHRPVVVLLRGDGQRQNPP